MIGLSDPLAAPVSQLAEPTSDGQLDENARDNCAGACLAWAIHQLAGDFSADGDELKDAAYGQGYTGLTAVPSYAAAVAPFGLSIATHTPATLDTVKASLGAGHPVIVAIPSDWGDNPPSSPYDHFVCIVRGTGGQLMAMNPWGGFWQTQPESWWAARFRLGACWELSREGSIAVWTIERDAGADVTGAHDSKGAHVGAGFAWELTQHAGWEQSDALIGESYYANGQCVCALDNGVWMDWSHTAPATVNTHSDGGAIVAALYGLTASAAARIQQLQADLAQAQANPPAPAPTPTPDPAEQAAVALVAALRTALS